MRPQSCKFFLISVAILVLFAASAFAANHHQLNGTWILVPTESEFGGEAAIQTGTVTINDREHNITVTRSFAYDAADQSLSYSFSTDGRENATIREGKTFKSKAKWDGDVLKVTTTADGVTTVERFTLAGDNTMRLVVERGDHHPRTLVFHRQ
jgi:hypothetical protein